MTLNLEQLHQSTQKRQGQLEASLDTLLPPIIDATSDTISTLARMYGCTDALPKENINRQDTIRVCARIVSHVESPLLADTKPHDIKTEVVKIKQQFIAEMQALTSALKKVEQLHAAAMPVTRFSIVKQLEEKGIDPVEAENVLNALQLITDSAARQRLPKLKQGRTKDAFGVYVSTLSFVFEQMGITKGRQRSKIIASLLIATVPHYSRIDYKKLEANCHTTMTKSRRDILPGLPVEKQKYVVTNSRKKN